MTQKDIARKLNISRSTVARAFSGGRINSETKEKILKCAQEIGYKPNNLAQELVRKNKKSVYIFLVDSISPVYVEDIIKGINYMKKKYSDYKIDINVIQSGAFEKDDSYKQFLKISQVLEEENVDALIVSFINDEYTEKIAEKCSEKNISLITLDTLQCKKGALCHIGPDYENMGFLTADFIVTGLREKGKILILNFEDNCNINRRRMIGFNNFIKDFKEIDVDIIQLRSFEQEEYDRALDSCKDLLQYDCIYSAFKPEYILNYLKEKHIYKRFFIAANDLTVEIQELLFERKIMGLIYQRPFYQGMIAVETIFNYLVKNTPIPKKINIEIDILLKGNISSGLYLDFV